MTLISPCPNNGRGHHHHHRGSQHGKWPSHHHHHVVEWEIISDESGRSRTSGIGTSVLDSLNGGEGRNPQTSSGSSKDSGDREHRSHRLKWPLIMTSNEGSNEPSKLAAGVGTVSVFKAGEVDFNRSLPSAKENGIFFDFMRNYVPEESTMSFVAKAAGLGTLAYLVWVKFQKDDEDLEHRHKIAFEKASIW